MGTDPNDDRLDWGTAPGDFRKAFDELKAQADAMRKQAEADRARLHEIDRRERFNELKVVGGDAVADVVLEDFEAGVELTPTILQAKALEKGQARAAAELAQAKAMGFDSVETFRSVLESVKAQKAAELQGMTANAAAADAGQGMPEPPKSASELAFEEAKALRAQGLPPDEVRAGFIGAKMAAALEEAAKTP